ncbi:hypothetical protein EDC56_0675 [Sinobacterium caligoides]|uniref:Uncharacterized protein n=1 Tax=Sinobacterium caligoides TaxID=933926 RepID=A0A3N2DZ41_9GAMM|nr:hypothetical protein [Sinobacterium caligoides]ROS05146.1 hypothetical protein EDC56_0675 [Sinobacterium caligoides]
MSFLCVPIKVDALVCDNLVSAVATQDDFSLLPYQNAEKQDISAGVANIASSIARDAFNNHASHPAGVHLHWSMPDALTKGEINDHYGKDGNNKPSIDMPTVPNRWLVVRQHKTNTEDKKTWVVESDYIHPEGDKPKRAICIPNKLNIEDRKENVKNTPFCYIGRQVELGAWLEEDKSKNYYLEELTALGWGTPYFSALYTDSYSVFGAYDPDIVGNKEVLNYDYKVYGWFSKAENDFVHNKLNFDLDDVVSKAKDIADWDVISGSTADSKTERMVCFGMVEFDVETAPEDMLLNDSARFSETEVCLAKSPYEAVSSYLSKTLAEGSTKLETQIENQLQALLYTDDITGTNVDFIDRLKKARHKEEFKPVDSGMLWEYIDEGSLFNSINVDDELRESAKALFHVFKKENAPLLKKINSLQQQMNGCINSRQSYRRQLYNDWSKYMLCLHPKDADSSAYPDPEKVRYMIERDTLPKLEECEAEIVHLASQIEAVGDQVENKEQLKCIINSNFVDFMKSAGITEILVEQVLLKVPGPRYWKAVPPSLLISGDIVQHSDRHGADASLKCQVIDTTSTLESWVIGEGVDSLDWKASPLSVNHWSKQPWSPLFMEWQVALKSERSFSKSITANQENYSHSHITDSYRVALNDDQYSLPSAAVDLTRRRNDVEIGETPTIVSGRSLFAFSNKESIGKKLENFEEHGESEVDQNIDKSKDFFNKSTLTVQSLDGLHDDLLMYSNATELKIFDPLSFSSPNNFPDNLTTRIAKKLNNTSFKLPKLGHDFIPIKSGTYQLTRLRVIDSFGRFHEVKCDNVLISQGETGGDDGFVTPRVLQPMRISVRWQDDIDVSGCDLKTPVSGWLCYNRFDETLVIYDADGKALGSMNSDGEWLNKDGNFEDLSSISSNSLKSFVLKILSFHSRNRIVKEKLDNKLWDKLIKNGVLHSYGDHKKAYLQPFKQGEVSTVEQGELLAASSGNNFFPKLKTAILSAQNYIEPEFNHQIAEGGVLKPLAIVRAAIDLQLMGEPETNKSWSALSYDLDNNGRTCREFDQVKFPMKIGEFNNLDDGLVGYWQVMPEGSLSQRGYFPQSDMDDAVDNPSGVEGDGDVYIDAANFNVEDHDYVDKFNDEGVKNLSLSFADDPLQLLMLIDPEARTHVTTGVVPKKTLFLEPQIYQEALESIQSDYFAAPILTPVNRMSLSLPKQKTWQWSQPNDTGGMDRFATVKVADRSLYIQESIRLALLAVQQRNVDEDNEEFVNHVTATAEGEWATLLDKGVLLTVPDWSGHAYYYDIEESMEEPFKDEWLKIKPRLLSVTTQGVVDPEILPALGNKVQVVEGWLTPLMEVTHDV